MKKSKPSEIEPAALSEKDAARYLGVSWYLLRNNRLDKHKRHKNPPHFKIGRKVLYPKSALDSWIHERTG